MALRSQPSSWLGTSTLFCLVLAAREVQSQEFAPLVGAEAPESRAWSAVGYDKTWVADAGYARAVWRPSPRESLALGAGLRVPLVLLPKLDAFGLAAGPAYAFVAANGLGFRSAVSGSVRTASDSTGSKVAARLGSELEPGYYRERWSIALQLSMTTTFATHIRHSEAVRDLFRDRYPEGREPANASDGPKDGWYGLTNHELRVGLTGGWRMTDPVALFALAGWSFRQQVGSISLNPPITALPFFVQLGGEFRW